mgnify:CR=1 FL=1
MYHPVHTLPQFAHLTDEEIRTALSHPSPNNTVANELTRLIGCYAANFRAYCDDLGYVPENIFYPQPNSPLEAFALRLTIKSLATRDQP